MLMTAGGVVLSFKRFNMAIKPPKVVVSLHDASSMVALGAAALAYSASRIASPSSPFTSGSLQLLVPLGGAGWTCVNVPLVYVERPKVVRNVVQSGALKTSVSSITTIVWPCPEMFAVKSGLRL